MSDDMEARDQGLPPEDGNGTGNGAPLSNDGTGGGEENGGMPSDGGGLSREEHIERSALGRRVSRMETQMSQTLESINTLLETLNGRGAAGAGSPDVRDEDVPEYINTREDLEKFLNAREGKKQKAESEYGRGYFKSVMGMESTNPDMHDEIVKELFEDHPSLYLRETGNPTRDAAINYRLAETAVLKRKLRDKRSGDPPPPHVKGGTAGVPTGMNVGDRHSPSPNDELPALDEFSAKYLKSIGAKPDDAWVKESLKKGADAKSSKAAR